MKDFILKYKWYFLGAVALIILIVGIVIKLTTGSNAALDKMTEWLFNKRVEVVKDAVKRRKKDIEKNKASAGEKKKEIEKLDKKIEKLDKKMEKKSSEIDDADLKELSDEFKEMGY